MEERLIATLIADLKELARAPWRPTSSATPGRSADGQLKGSFGTCY
jgi:hypothetical protein